MRARLVACRLGPAALGPALDNSWSRLAELCPDTAELGRLDWTPYERQRALDIIDRDRRTLFVRERAGTGAVEAQVWSYADDTSVILYVPGAPGAARLRAQLARRSRAARRRLRLGLRRHRRTAIPI